MVAKIHADVINDTFLLITLLEMMTKFSYYTIDGSQDEFLIKVLGRWDGVS